MSKQRLILIAGMGADERLFGPQLADGIRCEVPPFPLPDVNDDLPAYAARMARTMDLDENCMIGGVSFGGMVACELANIRQPRCVLLIASCRSCRAIPWFYHPVEWFSRILPDALVQRRCVASSRLLARLENLTEEQYHLIRDMSRDVPVAFLRRVGRMILHWKGIQSHSAPVYHIHGAKDAILGLKYVQPDEVVCDGGHLINLTHAGRVNDFIRSRCALSVPQESIGANLTE